MRGQLRLGVIFAGLLVFGVVLTSNPLRAEFYRYVGEDGAIHFTDDLSQVPPDQRKKMDTYSSTEPPKPAAPAVIDPDAADTTANSAKAAFSFLEEEREALMKRQENLKTEYQRILDTKAEVEQLSQTADTPEKQRALEEMVATLNADIAAYEAQSKALGEEINAFNSAVKAGDAQVSEPQ